MNGVSRRFVPHVAILTLLVAVPSLLHSRGDFLHDDCAHPKLLRPLTSGAYTDEVVPEERRHTGLANAAGEWGQWHEGSWKADNGVRVFWSVVRTFHPRAVYHRPQRQLLKGGSLEEIRIEDLDVDGGTIPIHWNEYEVGLSHPDEHVYAAYTLVYGGKVIANPIFEQLWTAPIQLVQGRWPMTRYFVFAREKPSREDAAREAVRSWLRQQWQLYQQVCMLPDRTGSD